MLNVMFSTFSTKPAPQRLLAVFAHRFGELSDPTVVLSQPFPFFLDSGWLIVFLHCSSLRVFAMYAPFEKRGQGGTRRAEREHHKCMAGGRGEGVHPGVCGGRLPPVPLFLPRAPILSAKLSFGAKKGGKEFFLCAQLWMATPGSTLLKFHFGTHPSEVHLKSSTFFLICYFLYFFSRKICQ